MPVFKNLDGTTSNGFQIGKAGTSKIAITATGAADKMITLTNATLTDNRTITLPNAAGTVVLGGDVTGSGLTMNTAKVLARTTAGMGAIEEKDFIEQYVGSAPTASSTGIKGQVYFGSQYYYICVATNTWVRFAVETAGF